MSESKNSSVSFRNSKEVDAKEACMAGRINSRFVPKGKDVEGQMT